MSSRIAYVKYSFTTNMRLYSKLVLYIYEKYGVVLKEIEKKW